MQKRTFTFKWDTKHLKVNTEWGHGLSILVMLKTKLQRVKAWKTLTLQWSLNKCADFLCCRLVITTTDNGFMRRIQIDLFWNQEHFSLTSICNWSAPFICDDKSLSLIFFYLQHRDCAKNQVPLCDWVSIWHLIDSIKMQSNNFDLQRLFARQCSASNILILRLISMTEPETRGMQKTPR